MLIIVSIKWLLFRVLIIGAITTSEIGGETNEKLRANNNLFVPGRQVPRHEASWMNVVNSLDFLACCQAE